jgi:hypothetical protein
MRSLSIFGVTGSIGEQTVDLICRGRGAAFRTVALTGGRNIARLAEIARLLRAEIAVCADPPPTCPPCATPWPGPRPRPPPARRRSPRPPTAPPTG